MRVRHLPTHGPIGSRGAVNVPPECTRGKSGRMHSVEVRFVGGAVVPVMVGPGEGVTALLGIDAGTYARAGATQPWWDAFGGRVEPDESVEHAAAREFYEETMGVLVVGDGTVDGLAHALVRREYLARVDMGYARYRGVYAMYTTFFVLVPYDADAPARFAACRAAALSARRLAKLMRPPAGVPDTLPLDGDAWGDRAAVAVVADAGLITSHRCVHGCAARYHTLDNGCTGPGTLRGVSVRMIVESPPRSVLVFVPCEDVAVAVRYVHWVRTTAPTRLSQVVPPAHTAAKYLEKKCIKAVPLADVAAGVGDTAPRLQTATDLWLTTPPR
jgi:8-oxo-dGTP pyrophosphatase MutT (NUDIX family)